MQALVGLRLLARGLLTLQRRSDNRVLKLLQARRARAIRFGERGIIEHRPTPCAVGQPLPIRGLVVDGHGMRGLLRLELLASLLHALRRRLLLRPEQFLRMLQRIRHALPLIAIGSFLLYSVLPLQDREILPRDTQVGRLIVASEADVAS